MCENASPRKKHDLHPPPRIKSLYNVLTKTSSDKLPNLAILTENEFLFSYKDRLSVSEFMTGHGPVSGLRPMRGDVMDFFAQLEFIVNKIFVTHLVNSKNEVRKFEQLLDGIDFFLKIRLLNEWSLIDNRAKERLICLKEVRNGFAHNWESKEIKYKGEPVVGNFSQFKKDATLVFSALIDLYNGRTFDIEDLIKELSARAEHAKDLQ